MEAMRRSAVSHNRIFPSSLLPALLCLVLVAVITEIIVDFSLLPFGVGCYLFLDTVVHYSPYLTVP